MENLFIWPQDVDWQEVRRVFITMSLIALFVSFIINRYLKQFPVLAVQLSILCTLAIYPMVNFYVLVANTDYDILSAVEKADPAHFGVLVFLSPLPVCILTAIVFFTFRNRKAAKKALQPPKSQLIPKAASFIISLAIGSVWLSVNMLFHEDEFHVTVVMFMFYTIAGFVMYLFSAAVLLVVKKLIARYTTNNNTP